VLEVAASLKRETLSPTPWDCRLHTPGTQYTYPWRYGQVPMTWVAGYIS